MSSAPIAGFVPVLDSMPRASRRARGTPRVRIPTRATRPSSPRVPSTISDARGSSAAWKVRPSMMTLGFIDVERASYRGLLGAFQEPGKSIERGVLDEPIFRMRLDEEVAVRGDERDRLALLELVFEDVGQEASIHVLSQGKPHEIEERGRHVDDRRALELPPRGDPGAVEDQKAVGSVLVDSGEVGAPLEGGDDSAR